MIWITWKQNTFKKLIVTAFFFLFFFLNLSPIPFQALPNCDCDGELPSAHGENMAEIIVPGFKGRICGRTSQTFTIGCSSNGEAPETVAVVRPDGEHKVK